MYAPLKIVLSAESKIMTVTGSDFGQRAYADQQFNQMTTVLTSPPPRSASHPLSIAMERGKDSHRLAGGEVYAARSIV
jgi:hypothetical protein